MKRLAAIGWRNGISASGRGTPPRRAVQRRLGLLLYSGIGRVLGQRPQRRQRIRRDGSLQRLHGPQAPNLFRDGNEALVFVQHLLQAVARLGRRVAVKRLPYGGKRRKI